MPTIAPAVEAPIVPALVFGEADDLYEVVPVTPEPVAGAQAVPGTPATITPASAPRVQVLLHRTVTHEPIGELRTADVDWWEEDVEEPGSASIDASSWDPMWELAAAHTSWYRGRPVYDWDPKGLEVSIGVDGLADWAGVFRQPLDVGGDRVRLPARGPEILLHERTLGRVEPEDHFDDWGDFERYPVGSTPPGLVLVPDPGHTMTATIVADAVRGRHCLEVTGKGWVRTPRVSLPGAALTGRTAAVSTFTKQPEGLTAGTPVVLTYVQRSDSLVPSNRDYTLLNAGTAPDPDGRWSDDPVVSKGRMTMADIDHLVWGELRGFDGRSVRYDLVRCTQQVLTGFVSAKTFDHYVALLLTELQHGDGGSQWGITSRIESHATGSAAMSWGHTAHHTGAEAMAMVTDVAGGAEWCVNPAWVARIMGVRGGERTDVLLGPDQVVEARFAVDPGAEVDDYVADTGRGSGAYLVASTWSAPVVAGRHRVTRIVRPPDGDFNAVDRWTAHHGPIANRRQRTAEVDVRWDYGRGIACGDVVPVALVDGKLGWWGRARIVKRRMRPREGLVTFTIGEADG